MSLDKDRLGSALWTRIKSVAGPYTPGIGATEDAQGELIWKAIADEIIKEVKTNGAIHLLAGDIPVNPGTFKDSLVQPITGVGSSQGVTLTGKIE